MKNHPARRAMSFSTTGRCWLFTFIVLLILCTFVVTAPVYAQFTEIPGSQINVDIIPEFPGANETVTVVLSSFNADINSANITWKINGKVEKTGKGEKTFSFTTGNTNTTTTLGVDVTTSEGESVNQTIKIRPVSVDLMWQTDSFVPPFYKGKAMFSHQNKITFIAIPHMTNSSGVEVSPKNLIYKWKKNGTVMESDSGYGKNSFSQIGSLISRPIDVSVEVTSPNTNTVGIARTQVVPAEPSIVFYRKNPLYGIEFERALYNTVELNDSKEISVIGIPFFFGILDPVAPELTYKWSINGIPINSPQSANLQVFRQKEGTSGVSNLSLSIENDKKILQFASNNFDLKFGNSTE